MFAIAFDLVYLVYEDINLRDICKSQYFISIYFITYKIMEHSKEHIRHCLLYEFQLGHTASEATRNICHAIGNGSMSNATACRWFERFRNNDYSLDDEQRSGRPKEINLDELKQAIER